MTTSNVAKNSLRSLSSKIVKGPLGDKDDRDHTLHSACLQFDWILLYQTRKYVVIGSKVTKYKKKLETRNTVIVPHMVQVLWVRHIFVTKRVMKIVKVSQLRLVISANV